MVASGVVSSKKYDKIILDHFHCKTMEDQNDLDAKFEQI